MIKGQMSIFDILDNDTLLGKSEAPAIMKNYLSKEDKIITLARKKKEKERQFKKNSFMEIFNFNLYNKKPDTDKHEYIMTQVRNCLVRPVFEQEMESGNAVQLCSKLLGCTPDMVSLIEAGSSPNAILKSFFRKKGNYKGGICLHWDKDIYIPFGEKCRLTKHQHLRSWTLRTEYNYHVCADAGMFMDNIVLLTKLREMVLSSINGLSEKDCLENPIYNYIISTVNKNLSKHIEEEENLIIENAWNCQFVREYLPGYKKYNVISQEEFKKMDCEKRKHVLTLQDFGLLFFIAENVPDDFAKYLQCSTFQSISTIQDVYCVHIFELLFEEYMQDKTEHDYENAMKKDYALSFQTKKNISEKTLDAMEKSSFNEWFGYVEFDEDVDLLLMDELEQEWKAIAKFLQLNKTKDVMLRFRKLGQHKAAGLFYSLYNCICVDIRNPSSMIHEYMHMLDYNNGKLSRKNSFSEISSRYAKCLKDLVKSNKSMEAGLKGKYNLSYYLTATEIFARCGEIYVTKCLGIDNSLVKPDGGFAYPDDKELIELIRKYYDNFLALDSKKICLA